MANETANRAAEALLPVDLLPPGMRSALMAETMPSFIAATDGRRILWSSHEAARRLAARDAEALMRAGLPPLAAGTERLAAIGRSLEAGAAKRLERLRFTIGFRSVALTCLVAPLTLASGEIALLVSFIEARAVREEAPFALETETAPAPTLPDTPQIDHRPPARDPAPRHSNAGGPSAPAWTLQEASERRALRFVFSLDRNGVVERVTPPLADAVGAKGAAIVGMPLAATIQEFDAEAAEKIRTAILGGATWSGISVLWPVDNAELAVPVDLSALPLSNHDDGLTGFSGFGRCHVDRAEKRATDTLSTPAPVLETPPEVTDIAEAAEQDVPELPLPPVAMTDLSDDNSEVGAVLGSDTLVPTETENLEEETGPDLNEERVDAAESPVDTPLPDASGLVPAPDAAASDASPNVISLRSDHPSVPEQPAHIRSGLSMSERNAFREIAKALGAKFDPDSEPPAAKPGNRAGATVTPFSVPPADTTSAPPVIALPQPPQQRVSALNTSSVPHAAMLDMLPVGLLVLRGDAPLFANRTLLDLTGYPDFFTFASEDGLRAIFRKGAMPRGEEAGFDTVVLATRDGEMFPVDAHLQLIDWEGGKASMISLRRALELEQGKALRSVALDLKRARSEAGELRAILDTATDGVATLDEKGRILSLNGAAEALFGVSENEVAGENFTCLLRNESHAPALDYFEGLHGNGVRSVLNDGREVVGREKKGGAIPLFMTFGRISDEEPKRYCAVLRDLTAWKRAEQELTEARQAAELASAKKSDFLTKISHEIRTPMNAIIGFAEVMMEERLGPVGTPKYREYLGDIRTSGKHVVSLVNDLLDLAKIEAGRMEMSFAATDINAIVSSSVGIIQPQANANRVLVRTQLAQKLPQVVADERSIRQIVLNMLSNATRFTEAGGQVIVATALLETGEAVIRIRDSGVGMSAREIEQALEPFRQVGTRRDHGGTGLGLPLTKALVEANRANFAIRSKPGEGTMVEITFPSTRVLAE